ncbi:P-loop ATPase, Sll1717 family [Lacrimispora amygdalina]|uniref:P-loop ATPase, Sll1717 family n=1 Tax=Lacrimispora amygdalina TaxID=253257 RepID=UPI000BE40B07|nr:hypothetical protein [Lacrimispora amygdalina]
MGNFKDVFLGYSDSDKEADRNPKMFSNSFYDPDGNIEELLNGDRFIISGRKGDGKSAYSAKISLLENEINISTAKKPLNNFNNITFEQLSTYKNLGGNPYISFWKCVLMIETVKLINEKEPLVADPSFIALVASLQESGLLETEDISRTITKLVETNTTFNLKSIFSRGKRRENSKILQGTEEIYLTIRKCISTLYFKDKRNYLLIDNLDDILSVENFEPKVITGLIKACDEINSFFNSCTLFLKIIVFVRADVLSVCRDTNFSKILRDSSIELSWKIEDSSDATPSRLIQLVKKRFEPIWGEDVDFIEIWEQIFEPVESFKSSLEYVLENIIYRPRDILQLMIEAQKTYVTGQKINDSSLKSILYNYSNSYFVAAMQDELTGFFPDEAVTVLPSVLSKLGQRYFNANDFKIECCKHKEFESVDSTQLLAKMFNDGYIGQHRPKEKKDYTVFKYRNPRENFIEEHECVVHRGLMRSLSIT